MDLTQYLPLATTEQDESQTNATILGESPSHISLACTAQYLISPHFCWQGQEAKGLQRQYPTDLFSVINGII